MTVNSGPVLAKEVGALPLDAITSDIVVLSFIVDQLFVVKRQHFIQIFNVSAGNHLIIFGCQQQPSDLG